MSPEAKKAWIAYMDERVAALRARKPLDVSKVLTDAEVDALMLAHRTRKQVKNG
jgi:hypothetical protein